MGWELGFDPKWKRDIGYGVPAICDHPDCIEEIDRGLSYVCGAEPYGGGVGCGLYFCSKHLGYRENDDAEDDSDDPDDDGARLMCERCCGNAVLPYFAPKPDSLTWVHHKLTDESWAIWRELNPKEVQFLHIRMAETVARPRG